MPPSRLTQPQVMDDLLLYRMTRLLAVTGSMVIRLCEGRYGITRREWRILGLLADQGPQLSSQLAESAQLDRARTSRAITSLVAKKLLARETGPADRRQARLSLTPAGQALHAELFPQVRALNESLVASLPAGDAQTLDAALIAMQKQAEALLADAELPKADRRRGARGRAAAG